MLHAVVLPIWVQMRWLISVVAFCFVEVRLRGEATLELLFIRSIGPSLVHVTLRLCVLIECLLISIFKEFIMHLLVIGTELLLLPLFEALPRILIILIHVPMLFLLIFLPLSIFFLMLLIHFEQIILSKCISLALSLEATICFLQ